jgi:hypothetical protein
MALKKIVDIKISFLHKGATDGVRLSLATDGD